MFFSIIILAGMLVTQTISPVMAANQCDSAQLIADLTVPDGASFSPGATFTKTWRLLNNGTCAWTTLYNLDFAGGDSIGAPLSVKLPTAVSLGQTVDISVGLTAPLVSGHYKGLWKISNNSGAQFGIGDSANAAFWVDINVVNNPHLEDGSFDTLPRLLTVPQNTFNGYIQATYPEIQIQQGDKLQTTVNCEFGAKGCYVSFRIDYLNSAGSQKTLWSWKEALYGRFYRANIDLR